MRLNFFKPTSSLDKFYEIGILVKGIDGLIELLAGGLLLVVTPAALGRLTTLATRGELAEDPHDFIATHLAHAGAQLAHGHHVFAAVFLLVHGAVKVGLVTCLLLNKLWAYPVGIVVLGLLLLYQLYQVMVHPTIGMALLSLLDAVIVWLIWREWQRVRSEPGRAAT